MHRRPVATGRNCPGSLNSDSFIRRRQRLRRDGQAVHARYATVALDKLRVLFQLLAIQPRHPSAMERRQMGAVGISPAPLLGA